MTRHSLLLAGSALVVLPFARPPAARAETLSELVSYALEHHPEVQAMASSVRAAEEAISPARTWPDPQLSVSIMNMGLTDWTVGTEPMAQASIGVAQEIPIGRKLGLRHEIAQADVTQARASLATTKNRIARDVALAALDLYELDQTVRIESQIRERYREMVRVAEGRLAVGQTMQQDVLGMMLDVDMSTVAITEALDRRNALVAKLNGLLNRPVDAPFESLTVAPLPSAPTDAASLIARALEDRPELSRLRATVAQAETMRRLAVSDRIPNPMVMARYANRGSMDGLYEVGMSMILPVRPDRRQNAAVREAAAVLDMRRQETSAAELETRTSVSSLVAELEANGRHLASYDQTLLPRAGQVVEASLASYSVGQTTLIMALDAVRRLHRLQQEALMREVMERRLFVELEQALGHAAKIADGSAAFVR